MRKAGVDGVGGGAGGGLETSVARQYRVALPARITRFQGETYLFPVLRAVVERQDGGLRFIYMNQARIHCLLKSPRRRSASSVPADLVQQLDQVFSVGIAIPSNQILNPRTPRLEYGVER